MSSVGTWLEEAGIDLQAAGNLAQAGFYAQACFHCQQGAEKALKALLIFRENRLAKSHSLRELADKAGVLPDVRDLIADLEGDYTATRYVDAATKPPKALYTPKEFAKRIECAKKILELVQRWTRNSERS